jgi:hypothetical protein
MKKLFAGLAGALVLAMTACGGGGAGGSVPGDAIQGKVSLPGGSAKGTQVIACTLEGDTCNLGGTAEAGSDGSYRITGLKSSQKYVVLGLLDTNNDGEPDYGGVYGGSTNPTQVSPPKGDVNFTLSAGSSQSQSLRPQSLGR